MRNANLFLRDVNLMGRKEERKPILGTYGKEPGNEADQV
jgi:hypothetical protein